MIIYVYVIDMSDMLYIYIVYFMKLVSTIYNIIYLL